MATTMQAVSSEQVTCVQCGFSDVKSLGWERNPDGGWLCPGSDFCGEQDVEECADCGSTAVEGMAGSAPYCGDHLRERCRDCGYDLGRYERALCSDCIAERRADARGDE